LGSVAFRKNFTLSFPERQGKGGRRFPTVFRPFAVAGSAIVARDRQEQRDLAPGERANEV
jgi:hypothetical protein